MQYRILIVDDEENILKAFKIAFKDEPYDMYLVPSGEEALQFIKIYRMDMIISDINMPNMDGIEFLKKSTEYSPRAARLALTNRRRDTN